MVVYFHAVFAALLVLIIWAINRQGERAELLIKGLELARKADAEAARSRQMMHFRAQWEAMQKVNGVVEELRATAQRDAKAAGSVRTGNGHDVGGHRG